MRTETVDAKSKDDALELCPWACEVREVDNGEGGIAYKCFESATDADIWDNQN